MIPRHKSTSALEGSKGCGFSGNADPWRARGDAKASTPQENSGINWRDENDLSASCHGFGDLQLSRPSICSSSCCGCHDRINKMKHCCETDTLPTVRSASSLTDRSSSSSRWSAVEESASSAYSIKIPSTWTVGKVSLIFLLLAASGDLILQQFRGLNNFEDYDALSTDVIRPAFSYKSSTTRPKTSLGSAAIGSVTNALSPILPFTGGVDLRREEYRAASPWETVQSLYTQTMEAFTPNAPSPQPTNYRRIKAERFMSLSASEPFVKTAVIAELTLADISAVFQYAVESNREGFDEAKFLRKADAATKKVVLAMKEAVARSRGNDAEGSIIQPATATSGSMDALNFSAAMRIFAEWRLLRQTPDGYKGFAVGMSLGHKDIVQNVAKIEQSVHHWLDYQIDEMEDPSIILRSPTIAQILQYETDMKKHPNLPRLMDKTAAMGLLWVRRQLQYQTALFANALMVPSKYPKTKDAVVAAYNQVYDKYHGWAVQKIFNYSFQSAPEAVEIYRHMNPHKLKEVEAAVKNGKVSRSPSRSQSDDAAGNSEDENPVAVFFVNVGNNIGNWWKDVTNQNNNVGSSQGTDDDEMERLISAEMVKDASQHITQYLQVVDPLLNDLAGVFDQYNMDDPTKV